MNSDDDKVTFQEIIGAVCKRPTMYTPTGSFYEIVSMLDGYGLGASVTPYHRTFTPFLQWAAGRF